MSAHRDQRILVAVREAGLPAEFATILQTECPWLDGATEVSESIGPDLLAEQAARAQLSQELIESFFYAYNAIVRSASNPFEALQSDAYAEVCAALVGQGRADAFGEGDYWVNSDSFSTRMPNVIVFNDFRFSTKATHALQRILAGYASVFSELRISSEEGDEVLTLRPQ